MSIALSQFPPDLRHARFRLKAFASKAGSAYAQRRNFDFGPGKHNSVSALSPYLRLRLLDEIEVSRAVLAHHTPKGADKFLAEVFWRTYWKGWMELRPTVWETYREDLEQLKNALQSQSGLRREWEAACLGKTGIAPFDAWAHELAETGYLHNHARMWFASIWLFTLKLPWQLGADFFLRHLLDGDVAVNTLSWRWVAGLQTQGKTYLARPDNIAKYTPGRFGEVRGLATSAPSVAAPCAPEPAPLPPSPCQSLKKRYGVLVHSEDVNAAPLLAVAPTPAACAFVDATPDHSPWQMAAHVAEFRQMAAQETCPIPAQPALTSAQDIADWASHHQLEQIIAPYAPVGPMAALLQAYQLRPDVPALIQIRRPLDTAAWPLATKGFFAFRKHIPRLLSEFVQAP